MNEDTNLPVASGEQRPDQITAVSILAGIGSLNRRELCSLVALMECITALGLAQGAVEDLVKRLRVVKAGGGRDLEDQVEALERSALTTSVLRHRLLTHLAKAFGVPLGAPLSGRSAAQMAAALAVRASERLSPAVVAERKRRANDASPKRLPHLFELKAADLYKAAGEILGKPRPLAFPELVREEMLLILSNEQVMEEAAREADPAVRAALEKGHAAAKMAMAAGGSWTVFAAIVGNAGFAPYILAAQLSAWIPMVSGPALVSLLATLINPATVLIGVGALAWYGVGKGAGAVRSQVAARLCVILAMSGTQNAETALSTFLGEMRLLDTAPAGALNHLGRRDRAALRDRLAYINRRLTRRLPKPSGPPPQPWNGRLGARKLGIKGVEAGGIATITAGEVLWSAAAIDHRVLEAADFSRSTDINDPMSLALHAQEFAISGADHALRGYVAERLVLDWLVAQGHDVALAESSNTPGLDLIMDGNPVQVKCGTDFSNLAEHFRKYPDIPVIANEELARQAAEWGASQTGENWADLVTTLPGFEISEIERLIADALGHAAALNDPGVLEIALSVGLLRGGLEVLRGAISIEDLPAWLIIDGATRGALGIAGGKVGAWVGLVAIGPAGALILGPAAACAALFGVGGAREAAFGLLMKDWHSELLREGKKLHDAVVQAVEQQIDCLIARVERIRARAGQHDQLGRWMISRAEDDLVAAIETRWDIGSMPTCRKDVAELLISARRLAPCNKRVLLAAAMVERCFEASPGLNEVVLRHPLQAARRFARDGMDNLVDRARGAKRRPGSEVDE